MWSQRACEEKGRTTDCQKVWKLADKDEREGQGTHEEGT